MKKQLLTAVLAGAGLLLGAAEPAAFTWGNDANASKNWDRKPITPDAPVTFTAKPENQYGPYMPVTLNKPQPGAMYRLTFEVSSNKPETLFYYLVRQKGNEPWISGYHVNRGPMYFYMVATEKGQNAWVFSFDKKFCGEQKIHQLKAEKLTDEEVKGNLLVNDGLTPGLWYGMWGKDNCKATVKDDESSPVGKILSFEAAKLGDGHKTTLPLPFIPSRKFEFSLWMRTAEPTTMMIQLCLDKTSQRIGVKKEWTEFKITGITPEKEPKNGLWFMIFKGYGKNDVLPAFDIGAVDFHYLP